MVEVIGPFDSEEFYLMSELKKSIAYLSSKDYDKYATAIEKERSILKDFYKRRVP